jgi:hypothetical protein
MEIKCIWYWGNISTAKVPQVFNDSNYNEGYYNAPLDLGDIWNNYNGQKIVIVDGFQYWETHFMDRLRKISSGDIIRVRQLYRNYCIFPAPEVVIVTSHEDPRLEFPSIWLNRFHFIHV